MIKLVRRTTTIAIAIGIFMVVIILGTATQMKSLLTGDNYIALPDIKNIVYPKSFQLLQNPTELMAHYQMYFNELSKSDFMNVNVFKYQGDSQWNNAKLLDIPYHTKSLSLYEHKDAKCEQNQQRFDIEISDNILMDGDLTDMVVTFSRQLANEEAFKELQPYFKDDITLQFKIGSIDKHWYKFAGTSVWLEEFGVHLMISRVLYSPVGNKRKQLLSLTYAQIFDANWIELKDVELINLVKDEHNDNLFQNMKFPCFLPIPFHHNPEFTEKKYYGTEDPRLFLITNELGKPEPLIIFNAYHRKVVKDKLVDAESMNINFDYYRSMFLTCTFRYQRCKSNVDGIMDTKTENVIYNKAVELRRSDVPRLAVQKNWTPMLSHGEREEHGYDKYIYFVYRWSKLEILKCNLNSFVEGTSLCEYEYKRMMDLSKDEVGPLRGGSEMINLRDIVKDKSIELPDKEIWIGFPRAHITGCGCGKDMYRPNLAVITKEADNKYKISQLSSFTSLDVEVYGWTNPKILCAKKDPNVLISNGISGWELKDGQDFLTLTLSVADATNNIVHIKNLLSHLIFRSSILKSDATRGYDDVVVDCALTESTQFCKAYGDEMKQLGKVPPPEPEY